MSWLNYHHLFYFWTIAKLGSVTGAATSLRLSPSTVSAQVKALEDALGERLLARSGRRVELTEMGKVALRYAEEIFATGREMQEVFAGGSARRPEKLTVGVSDLVPKLMLHRLLAPALSAPAEVRVICREDKTTRLLGDLSAHEVDLVIAESPIGGQASAKAFNHLLGETGVSFFATAARIRGLKGRFPGSLTDAPLLVPTENTPLRRSLDRWLEERGLRPRIVAEFEDTALLKTFGSEGVGLFPGPTAIEAEICDRYGVRVVGRAPAIIERFYAITIARRIAHPVVRLITENARDRVFGPTRAPAARSRRSGAKARPSAPRARVDPK